MPENADDLHPSRPHKVIVGTYVTRALYDQLQRAAMARHLSVSAIVREQLVKAFPPAAPIDAARRRR
jgi:hypothetical protein